MRSTGVPILVAGARSERLLKDRAKEKWNVWRMAPSDREAAERAAQKLSVRWRGRPWAVVDDGTAFGRTFADDFRALMEEAGQPPQFADNFRPAQSTQAGLVRRLQRSGVSAVFVAANAEDVAVIADGMRQAGASFELAGGPTLDLLPWIEQADVIPNGLLAVIEPDPASLDTARELTNKLAAREIEPEPYVYLGYAALEIAITAARADPAEATKMLADSVFHTVLGNVDFDGAGRNRLNPYRLRIWQDGAFRPVTQEPAESPQ
jgi:branched-chain amino acid transport system substrate-binding protein